MALYQAARAGWAGSDKRVTLKEAASVPGASLGMRIGDGPEQMLVLAAGTARNNLWISRARVAIATDHGRIVRTAGLQNDLGGYAAAGGAMDSTSLSWSQPATWQWVADFPDINAYSVRVVCHDQPAGRETIRILGTPIQTVRVNENCSSPNLHWSFENTFWVSPTNEMVWQSVQHVHPEMDAVEIRLFRPPT